MTWIELPDFVPPAEATPLHEACSLAGLASFEGLRPAQM